MTLRILAVTTVTSLALAAGVRARGAQAKPGKPAIDPEAIEALHKMGAFLRDQQKFSVRAAMTTDDLLASGQKVQFAGTVELMVRRPDRMRMDIRGDRRDQHLYYDGKTFTVFGERVGYYASFDAPPTLTELKGVLEKRGVDMPLADLFYWGSDQDRSGEITGATPVGTSTIEGTSCNHFAFRQKDVDWELWVEQGQQPLPRKVVITTTSEKTRPQHSMVLTWDLSPQLGDELFAFVPPPQAHKIRLRRGRSHRWACTQGRSAMSRHGARVTLAIGVGALLLGAGEARARVVVRTAVAYRPVARAVVGTAVVATAAVATAAVIGSVVNTLPPQCVSTVVGNVAYQQCGSSWYQPRYTGSNVTYVVVNPPQ